MQHNLSLGSPSSALTGEGMEDRARLRAKLCLLLLLIGFMAVALKLVFIQVLQHDFWLRYVEKQRKSSITIQARRGAIYDRNRTPFATSIVQEILCVSPPHVTNPAALAKALAPYVGITKEQIVEKICNTSLFLVYLERGFDVKTRKEIAALKLSGVEFRSEHSRHYPKGSLASNLIGFSNLENKGIEGIEYRLDSQLAGENGKQIVIKDNSRREIAGLAQTVKEARDGNHVVLTIDEVIQYITEKALDEVVRSFSPESAAAVVIRPKTGEVLAMASRPTFDPNKSSTRTQKRLRNRAVTDAFEPGSAFKPMAAAAALERNVVSPDDREYCEHGSLRIRGHTFHDVHPHGEISFAEILAYSSNIGMIKVVSHLEPDYLYKYIVDFGFGQRTNIGLSGESPGIVRPPSKWSGLSMASLPIGQEMAVTTLQLAVGFSAIANEGRLMKPYVLSEVISADDRVVKRNLPTIVRQVIQPTTAATLTQMLEGVVDFGTGAAAKVKGYRCAGKTGTAQKADPEGGGYFKDKYVAVFGGFVPADDPAACIVVMADSPQHETYGGKVAAPAFREIAQGIVNYLEIPPTETTEIRETKTPVRLISLKNPADKGRGVRTVEEDADGQPLMPDVSGMTMKQIMDLLSPHSVRFEFKGSGIAVRQAPAPGVTIEKEQLCKVEFKRIDI